MKKLQRYFAAGVAHPKVYSRAHKDVLAGFKEFEKKRNSTMCPNPWRKSKKS